MIFISSVRFLNVFGGSGRVCGAVRREAVAAFTSSPSIDGGGGGSFSTEDGGGGGGLSTEGGGAARLPQPYLGLA